MVSCAIPEGAVKKQRINSNAGENRLFILNKLNSSKVQKADLNTLSD
ncbi:MAG: Uncharacterised protein [Flavobacteriaceae bacterium]|nr:MAG: Uncharacterised protein [Flavobacteriaceae bacterium]